MYKFRKLTTEDKDKNSTTPKKKSCHFLKVHFAEDINRTNPPEIRRHSADPERAVIQKKSFCFAKTAKSPSEVHKCVLVEMKIRFTMSWRESYVCLGVYKLKANRHIPDISQRPEGSFLFYV